MSFLLSSCHTDEDDRAESPLHGTWVLRQKDSPVGTTEHYPLKGKTYLNLYEGDSLLRQCELTQTPTGLVITPSERLYITLINKGNGQWFYLEEDEPRPLTIVNDTTITIQRYGRIYTWARADSIDREWGQEIRNIFDLDLSSAGHKEPHSFMLSAKERKQAGIIHCFVYATIGTLVLLFFIVQFALSNRRERQRLQSQLRQIQEEHEERPQSVKKAIENVVEQYFSSEEYLSLQRSIARGDHLRQEDWDSIEQQMKQVFPGFGTKLLSLHPMSELEYQTCLLIKLRIAPSDIANVLNRDSSTISTVRSRLYQKVFHQKGGSKEWDEFVMSIGE